jgi:RNA polymerase sigma factor (sigma-70 family)
MAPLFPQRAKDRVFERMYRRHVGDVYHYALAVLHNETDAEDVTQTTFMNAYRALGIGERPDKPKNWLIAIAHNVCRQRFRSAARRPKEVPLIEEAVAELIDEGDHPSAQDICRALSHLSFNQRSAIVMRELEGRSYDEIAQILQLSRSAVETLIFRARRALREQLEENLTCREAEAALSRRADGQLGWSERPALRAHLRECTECAGVARRQRAQRTALRGLAAAPVPSSLAALFGGGTATGGALVAKTAAVAVVAVAVGTGTFTAVEHAIPDERFAAAAAAAGIARERVAVPAPAATSATAAVVAERAPRVTRAPVVASPGRRLGHRRRDARAEGRLQASGRHALPVATHRPALPPGLEKKLERQPQRAPVAARGPTPAPGHRPAAHESNGKSEGHRKNGRG